MRPPVAANGVGGGERAAVDVQAGAVDRAERGLPPQLVLAERRVLPGGEGAEHLGREGLVDLVVVEVLEGEAGAVEHPRHRVGRCHQQAFALVDVVDGGGLGLGEVGEDRQVVRLRPLLAGEEHRGGAVGERGRIGRRHRPLGAAEDRFQLGELLRAGVGTQVAVAVEAEVGGEEVLEEAAVIGGGEVAVRGDGQLVLGLSVDPPFGRHDRAVLAHREAGPRLLVAGDAGGRCGRDGSR